MRVTGTSSGCVDKGDSRLAVLGVRGGDVGDFLPGTTRIRDTTEVGCLNNTNASIWPSQVIMMDDVVPCRIEMVGGG